MSRRSQKAAALRHLMETEGDAVNENARGINRKAGAAIREFERFEELRAEARAIKEDAVENLPDLVDDLTESVEANGGNLYLAQDAADANRYVEGVMADHDAEKLVKSKSMTTEELGLNEHLDPDYEVVETDLGEYVIQVADEAPSHLIGPAFHKSPEDIAELFNEHFDLDEPLSANPVELTEFARERVGRHIREADVGMTGANFVVAETGSVAVVTNEGNARKSAVTPPVHVAVTGVEKILPTVEDLQPFTELIARTGTGQDISVYLSLFSPPVDTPTVDFETGELGDADDREFHLVLVDNGRMAMREDDDLRETLYCIRCGACANACTNFQSVGGHAFGGDTYTGGIGTGWEAGIFGLESAADMNDLCTGCTRCHTKCPVDIDIAWINTVVRDRLNRAADPDDFDFLAAGLAPDEEPAGLDVQKRAFGNVGTLARLGSLAPELANTLAGAEPVRWLLDRYAGIDRRRPLPAFADETLREWALARESLPAADAEREVVLYPDVYTNYFDPDRGRAAVRVLEALGASVRVPDLPESGRAPLSQGMVETAREQARAVYAGLAEHVDAGRDVVVVEPSDLSMFRDDYAKLLPEKSAERVGEASYEVLEYVYGLLENGGDADALPAAGEESGAAGTAGTAGAGGAATDLAYHSHCQQRTLGLEGYTTAVLESRGYDVVTSGVECCGMAGSFGYKSEYYEVSMDAGEHLRDDLDADGRALVASGTSCGEQLEALFEREARHPVEVLDPGPESG